MRFDIEFPGERTEQVYEETLRTFDRQARLPGFRPGKAPRTLLVRQYSKQIDAECRRELLRLGIRQVVADGKLAQESVPRIEDEENLSVRPGEPFAFSLSFDVAPSFELPEYKGIRVLRELQPVDDTHVDHVISGWLRSRTSYDKVERASEAGDLLKVTYSGVLEEACELPETSRSYLSGNEIWLPLREPELIPGTIVGLAGMEAGQRKELEVEFPAGFSDAALAGKKAQYTFTILEVHGSVVPELTDDLAKTLGAESVEDMRERVRSNLLGEREQRQQRSLREQVLSALLSGLDTLPLPPMRLRQESHQALLRLYDREARAGATPEQLRERQEELRRRAEQEAAIGLRRRYVLLRIAEREKIEPDMTRVNHTVSYLAAVNRVTPRVMARQLRESGRIEELVNSIREEQVVERLLEWAEIVEQKTGKE
ncbi:MAG: trigger factor [Lentisphaeria bacterium]|nr:trigger factor [Lentisphaeria bacterium]